MKKIAVIATVAAGVLGAVIPMSVAEAAPTVPGNALDAIRHLDDRGYTVRIIHEGRVKPLDQSSIVSVRYDQADRLVHVTVR